MLDCFPLLTVVFFKYGQKTPFVDLADRIRNMVTNLKIPLEIAFGKQYTLSEHFVCAQKNDSFKKFSFSNFLSNDMCNVLNNDVAIAQTFCRPCYRLSLYNTWQHQKKDVYLGLRRGKGCNTVNLESFKDSLVTNFKKIGKLSKGLDISRLRLKMNASINEPNDLQQVLDNMLYSINLFSIVKVPTEHLQKLIEVTCLSIMSLFRSLAKCNDARALSFLFLYGKLLAFIFSTEKLTKTFIESNCGVFILRSQVHLETWLINDDFFRGRTLPQVWATMNSVFCPKDSGSASINLWYCVYVAHFGELISFSNDYLNRICTRICEHFSAFSIVSEDQET